jgi:oligopeptide/dipeptide ABC transporter ATP-binding protein
MKELLVVEDLTVGYRPLGASPYVAVRELSFVVPEGSVVGLVGESGSGKSTASLACLGLTRGTGSILGGTVRLGDRELLSLTEDEWQRVRGKEIALITQNPRASLHPVKRVGDQISEVYRAHTSVSAAQARERALELLKAVGINDPERRYDAYPNQLSGGMAQRIVIAMALSCSPRLIIADEPTSGLDVTVQGQILDDLVQSVRYAGSGLVLVTQDLGIVANYCDHIYLLHAGELVEAGNVSTFFAEPSHPAALALLAAQRRKQYVAVALRGMPIDVRARPEGCQLAPRCPFADESSGCYSKHPGLVVVDEDHTARCFRLDTVERERRKGMMI